jgi:hypothetical protein
MDVSKLIELMSTYPQWVRVLFGAWTVLTAILLFVLVFFHQNSAIPRSSTGPIPASQYALLGHQPTIALVQERAPFAIVDRSTGAGLDDTIALALDPRSTHLQREGMRERLRPIEACGALNNVARIGSLESQCSFLLSMDIRPTILGASTSLLFANFPHAAEPWLHTLRPGDQLILSGSLEVVDNNVSIRDARPLRG